MVPMKKIFKWVINGKRDIIVSSEYKIGALSLKDFLRISPNEDPFFDNRFNVILSDHQKTHTYPYRVVQKMPINIGDGMITFMNVNYTASNFTINMSWIIKTSDVSISYVCPSIEDNNIPLPTVMEPLETPVSFAPPSVEPTEDTYWKNLDSVSRSNITGSPCNSDDEI